METEDPDMVHLRAAIAAAASARARGNHPFGAVLVNPQGQQLFAAENTVVTEHDVTGHAESNLVRMAAQQMNAEDLAACTLYTSTEPCPMCAGAIYWAGIGRVVYGQSEHDLKLMTGNHAENPTLDLPCRVVFGAGQRDIEVIGPLLADEAAALQADFWAGHDK